MSDLYINKWKGTARMQDLYKDGAAKMLNTRPERVDKAARDNFKIVFLDTLRGRVRQMSSDDRKEHLAWIQLIDDCVSKGMSMQEIDAAESTFWQARRG